MSGVCVKQEKTDIGKLCVSKYGMFRYCVDLNEEWVLMVLNQG